MSDKYDEATGCRVLYCRLSNKYNLCLDLIKPVYIFDLKPKRLIDAFCSHFDDRSSAACTPPDTYCSSHYRMNTCSRTCDSGKHTKAYLTTLPKKKPHGGLCCYVRFTSFIEVTLIVYFQFVDIVKFLN